MNLSVLIVIYLPDTFSNYRFFRQFKQAFNVYWPNRGFSKTVLNHLTHMTNTIFHILNSKIIFLHQHYRIIWT